MVHYRFTMIHEHSDAVTYVQNKTNKNYNYTH